MVHAHNDDDEGVYKFGRI